MDDSDHDLLETRFKDVRENLQTAVTRQRNHKSGPTERLDAEIHTGADFPESRLPSGWEQNSFLTPLDSRSAVLGK